MKQFLILTNYETPACEVLTVELPYQILGVSNEPIGGGNDPDEGWD